MDAATALVAHSPLDLCLVDVDSRFVAVSQGFLTASGLRREDLIGVKASDLFGSSVADIVSATVCKGGVRARTLPPRRFEKPDGEPFWVETMLWPVCDDAGAAIGVMCVSRNITSEQKLLADLSRAEALLDAVVENIPSMLVVQELGSGNFVRINRATAQFLGRSREELIGNGRQNFSGKEGAKDHWDLVAQAEATGDTVAAERPTPDGKGRVRILQSRHRVIEDGGGVRHVLTISDDITETRQAEDKLRAIAGEAEAANRAKSEFLANMSHEIRTPLNGVMGIASALARTELRPDQAEMVGLIEMSAKTLEALLSDILDLARIEAGRMELKAEPFDLATSVNACGALFSAAAEAKGLKYQVSVDPAAIGSYIGDAPRLRQILSNLLGNAVKFTQSGSISLRVSAVRGETSSALRFDVQDTGIGFDAETKARLFGRFEQADGSITRRFGGTGLGLAISRSLAEAMGGTLDAQGEPGRGAVFSLTLDLTRCVGETELWSAGGEIQDEGAELDGFRVLVAEDHPTNRRVVELILGSLDLDLVCVEDGAQAVAAAERERFDLILMDMQMPVMDGLAAIREIRALEARTGRAPSPIFALTANAMQEHVAASAAAGANGHLTKPITADALIATVERAASGEFDGGEAMVSVA
ncbi:MAG: PAS domain S-box protein [Caulobacteraceae bacterium]|nr:PAS domain S-box protein [Caulobacteraceae bacterium]